MPRDLPRGNGDFLVTFDTRYQLRDIYYPNVGQENHTVGEPSRFGVWVDGQFAWTGDDGWDRHITYEHETLVGDTALAHFKLGLSLRFRDAVDFDRNIYLKEITVEDALGRERQVRFFQHFAAHLYGNDTGDSAYYDPRSQAVVHYKGRRYFLISGSSGGSAYGLSSFAIGQKDAPGKEGTWRDAEDGELSRNPVAQGSIDSVGMVAVTVPARGTATAVFWIAAGQAYEDVRELDKLVRERTPASFLARTKDYWRLWANKDEAIAEHLPDDINGLYKRSALVHRTPAHDRDIEFIRPLDRKLVRTGADFMATYREPRTKLPAPSFDLWEERRGIHAFTTAAVWAGLTAARNFAVAFGQHELAKRYAVAAQEIRDAALIHLWDADRGRFVRTVNVLPDGTIVKDATIDISLAGIFLFGLLPASDDRIRSTMRAIEDRLSVKTPVGGIARYENDYYFQVSSDIASVPGNPWFVATLWLAEHLIAIAEKPGDLDRPRAYLDWCASRALPSGVMSEQVHPYTGEPLSVSPLTWSHAAFVSAVPISDIASVPGNPWFVATLWLAEHLIAIAEKPGDLDRPRAYLDWCASRALPSGVMSEQVHPYTGEPLSVSPLTWSHAAFVSAVQHYARRSRLIKDRLRDQVKTAGEVIV